MEQTHGDGICPGKCKCPHSVWKPFRPGQGLNSGRGRVLALLSVGSAGQELREGPDWAVGGGGGGGGGPCAGSRQAEQKETGDKIRR